MKNLKNRFIDLATRIFPEHSEKRLAARSWLEGLASDDDPQLPRAIKRWEAADGGNGGRVARWVWIGTVAAVSVFAWIPGGKETREDIQASRYLVETTAGIPKGSRQRVFRNLTEDQKLLFARDTATHPALPVKERLWQKNPEDPALFAEYATLYLKQNDSLPPGYFETAARLAPTNSWFAYHVANHEARKACSQNPDGSYKITDEERMERVLSLLRQARSQKDFETYHAEMLSRRIAALPQRNLLMYLDGLSQLANSHLGAQTYFTYLPSAICARSWTAAETRDAEAFREISTDAESFGKSLCKSRVETMMNEVILYGCVSVISKQLAADAEKLGLSEEHGMWNQSNIRDYRKDRATRALRVDGKAADRLKDGPWMLSSSLESGPKVARSQPVLTHADLKPGILHEHAVLSRFLALATWLLVAAAMSATFLYQFRVSALQRGLARRAVQLLDTRDWLWITGGALLPFLMVMAVTHLTPLGGQGSGLGNTALILPAGHFLGLWLLWLIAIPQIVAWRLAKRAGMMGFSEPSWIGWLATGCAAAFVPLIGWAAVSHSFPEFWKDWLAGIGFEHVDAAASPTLFRVACGFAAVAALWILVRGMAAVFARADGLVPRSAGSVLLVRALSITLVLCALCAIASTAAVHNWFEKEKLMKWNPDAPGWNVYEYRVAVQAREELRTLVGD